eukprot:1464161-Rhodomonas_salina.2
MSPSGPPSTRASISASPATSFPSLIPVHRRSRPGTNKVTSRYKQEGHVPVTTQCGVVTSQYKDGHVSASPRSRLSAVWSRPTTAYGTSH